MERQNDSANVKTQNFLTVQTYLRARVYAAEDYNMARARALKASGDPQLEKLGAIDEELQELWRECLTMEAATTEAILALNNNLLLMSDANEKGADAGPAEGTEGASPGSEEEGESTAEG